MTNYDHSDERWTVDDPEDFIVIKNILNHFRPNLDFSSEDVLKLKQSNPEYFTANQEINRNEGAGMGTGQKLWKRASKIIPGGNMLLSKRAEMFLPKSGLHIMIKQKDVLFGIWMGINIMICLLWVLEPTYWAMQMMKLIVQ